MEGRRVIRQGMLRLERPYVYCRLFFDRDIILDIRQMGRPSLRGALQRLGYSFRWRFYVLQDDIKTLLCGSIPGHQPWIRIRLGNDDAKAIYRSLNGDIHLVLLASLLPMASPQGEMLPASLIFRDHSPAMAEYAGC